MGHLYLNEVSIFSLTWGQCARSLKASLQKSPEGHRQKTVVVYSKE